MDSYDINMSARDIAEAVHRRMREGKMTRVDFDSIRCAVAGYLARGADRPPTAEQLEQLENQTLRKFVERCA